MKNGKVLMAAPVHAVLSDGLLAAGYELVRAERITQEMAFELITGCVGVITSTRLQLDRQLLDAAPGLQWIGRMGSGMEVIDVPYATSRGIACFSSPEGNSNAVGEHALGMLLGLTKKIVTSHREVKGGAWIRDANRGMELEGKTVAIIGYGHTGRAFARKLAGFDVHILVYDKYHPEGIPDHLVRCDDLEPVFAMADIVSFHVPLQEDTIHYFDNVFLERMRKDFILVNTSRGRVVDTRVLYQGLISGKVAGACLDVLETEPPSAMDPELSGLFQKLLNLRQVLVTPHIAGYSEEALYKMSSILLARIVTGR